MKRLLSISFFLLICSVILSTTASSQVEPLQVMQALPQGVIEGDPGKKDITVFFNKSMSALEAIPVNEANLLSISPQIPGKFRWKNNKTLVFTPDIPLPNATRFTVTIPTTLKALDDSIFSQPYAWTFETQRPNVVSISPYNGAGGITLSPEIIIGFNQPVNPDMLRPFIKLFNLNSNSPLQYNISWNGNDKKGVKITPAGKLEVGNTYKLVIEKGLTGTEGPLPMESSNEIMFSTYGALQFRGTIPALNSIYPENYLRLIFSNPIYQYKTKAEIASVINIEPNLEPQLAWYDDDWVYGSEVYVRYNFKPGIQYKVTLKAGIRDVYGQTLGKDEVITFTVGHYHSGMNFKEGLGILESYLDKKVAAEIMNVQSLDIKKKKVPLGDIINVYKGMYRGQYLNSLSWDIDKRITTKASEDKWFTQVIDMQDTISGNSGIGLLYMYPHGNNFQDKPSFDVALYNITNIGVTAKISPYSGLVWVSRLKDSTPVAGAKVELRDEARPDLVLWSGVTNENGFVYIPGKLELNIKDELWVLVRHPDGVAFTSSGWDWGIEPYRFGLAGGFDYSPKELAGDIFTERGLYKPGEEVQIKGIIREKKDKGWMIPHITSGKLIVYESSYDTGDKIVYSDNVSLSYFGTFNRTVKLKDEIPAYNTLYIKFVPNSSDTTWQSRNTLVTSFQVATFRPASFKTEVQSIQDNYIVGSNITAKVKGSYLFGAPLKDADLQWSISRKLIYYEPPDHEGYIFGSYFSDYFDNERNIGGTISGNGKLDTNGNFDISAKIDYPSNLGPAQCTVEARVSDLSKQEISGRTNILIHPGEFYIGLKSSSSFIKEKETLNIGVISALKDGELVSGKQVKVSLVKREWKSAKKLGENNEYRWVSEKQDTMIEEKTVTTDGASASVSFQPQQAGYYLIIAASTDSSEHNLLTTSYLYVSGLSYVGWYMNNNDRIELVSDKKRYQPGDTAKILVKSPYQEVDALVTVEREGVLDHWLVKLHGNAASIDIPIKNNYLPNVYVSVMLIKGRLGVNMFNEDKQDIGKPAFKIGYIGLPVSPAEKKLTVTIKPSGDTFKPGGDVSADIEVKDNEGKGVASEVSLAVVDEGVLNLIGYNIPDPFDVFYGPRPLSVSTSETRHHIIGQRIYGDKGDEGGGGDEFKDTSKSMSDIRKDFRYTAYWLPSVITGSDGKAHVTFKLPDSITSYRLMAVANTLSSSFGGGKSVIKARKPLMVTPVLPRFIRVNDEMNAGVMIYNYSGHPMDVNLQAMAQGVNIKGATSGKYTVQSGDTQIVRFTYTAPPDPASATITFVAKEINGEEQDGVSVMIPVVKANPTEVVGFFGNTNDTALEKVRIPDMQGQLSVSTMSTALSGLSGTVEYLFDYPYGCLEQTLSRILPMILFGDTVDSFNLPTIPGGKYREVVQTSLNKIKLFQKYDGSFGLWQDSHNSDPYVSAYAVFTLIEAQKHGYSIDQNTLNKGLDYMKTLLRQTSIYPYSEYELNTVKSFALYVLSDKGMYDPSYAQYLYERRGKLPFFARAYLLMAITEGRGNESMQNELQRELLNGLVYEGGIAHIEEPAEFNSYWLFSSDARSTAAVLMAIMRSSPEGKKDTATANPSLSKKIMDKLSKVDFLKKFVKTDDTQAIAKTQDSIVISMVRWLSEKAKGGRWRSTQENLFVFWALGTYSKLYEAEVPNFTANVDMGAGRSYTSSFTGRSLKVNKKELPFTLFRPQEMVDMNIKKTGTGMLFYKLQMNYAPKGVLPPLNEGIGVVKSYYTLDGKPVVNGAFNLGEIYRVKVELTTTHDRSYVVMESLLPSGFEPMNTSFETESRVATETNDKNGDNEMYGWWYSPFNRSEMWDDRIVVFSNYLPTGTSTYTYLIRATIPGRFYMPPDHAEMMYYPEIFGRTAGSNIEIK